MQFTRPTIQTVRLTDVDRRPHLTLRYYDVEMGTPTLRMGDLFDDNEELVFRVRGDRGDRERLAYLSWMMDFEVQPGEEGTTLWVNLIMRKSPDRPNILAAAGNYYEPREDMKVTLRHELLMQDLGYDLETLPWFRYTADD
jgi:hypothetical protein